MYVLVLAMSLFVSTLSGLAAISKACRCCSSLLLNVYCRPLHSSQGNSVEQYRIYEALESGSIPVIAHEGSYARERLPPEFFDSPILFVDDWKDAPKAMMDLWNAPGALLARQEALIVWYDTYMTQRIEDLERVIESHYADAQTDK